MNSRKQKKRIAARRRVLFLEKLEQREVLAGNVTAAIRGGGDLFVKGDNQGNDITITQNAPGSVTITGNGTTVNGQPSVTLNNFHDDVIIDLNGGSDTLSFESTVDDLLRLPGGLTIHTEGGNDEINFSDTAVKGHVHIDTGSGNDHINAFAGTSAWGLRALSTSTILAGSGNDVVSLADSCFNKTANILMERDDDRLFLSHTKFNKAAILNGGLGYDRLSTVATSFAKRPVIVLFAVRNNAPPPSNNTAPVAVNDAATLAEGASASINVAANDTDSDGSLDLTSVVITQNPANGSVTVNNDGTVSYTHNGSETTSDSFRYTIEDDDGGVSNTGTVNITITPVNDPPVAVNDTATVAEGGNLSIPVSTNDTDADGTIDATSIVVTQNPANGSAIVNSNGSVTYTHNGSDTTSDSFRYTIKDNTGAVSGTATVAITVTPVNDAPVAVDDTATVAEAGNVSIPVSTNDTDSDGTIDLTSIVVTQNPANGSVIVNSNGTVSYTHNGSETTSDSFRYTIKDNSGAVSGTATVNITVTPVNDAPVASNGTLTTAEDTPATGTLVATDVDTAPVTYSLVATGSAHGTVTVTDPVTGAYSYSPDLNYSGPASFTFKANDGTVDSNTATITITVTPVNDAPVASDGTLTTAEDTPATGTLVATDVDTAPVTYSLVVTSSAHGTVTITDPVTGAYSYSPDLNYSGPASFTFKANDGTVDSNTATITITVTPVNDAPVASDGTLTTAEDTPTTGTLVATDVDTAPVTYSLVATGSAHGTVTITDPVTGAYSYSPDLNYSGPASFTFKANDGTVDSNTATITITVTPVNDAPVASDGTLTTAEDTPATGTLVATDVDTAPVTYSLVATGSAHGTVTITDPVTGAYSYSPDLNYSGPASFTFKANDGTVDSNTATITITVTPVNDAPTAVNDEFTINEDGSLILSAPGILGNDTDPEGNPLTASLVDSPLRGTLSLAADGSLTYTPDPNFHGTDGFSYTANDGTTDSAVAAVTINVTSVNDAPVALNDMATTAEDTDKTFTQADLKGNDEDVDNTNAELSVTAVSNPLNGTVVLNGDGTITFTPTPDFSGTAGFDYTLSDGSLTDTGHVTITVTPVNDAPVALNDNATTAEDTDKIFTQADLKGNDEDVDNTNAELSVTAVSNPINGTVVLNGDGTVTFTPTPDFSGTAGFDYTLSDGTLTDIGHVTITVTPVNDAPVALNDNATTAEDTDKTFTQADLKGNDEDVDNTNAELSVTAVSNPINGTVVLNGDGTITFTPTLDFTGTAGFDYTLSDGSLTDTGHVSITVTPVNDAPVALNDNATTAEDTDKIFTQADLKGNDEDVDNTNAELSVTAVSNPINGTVVLNGDGTVTFTPTPDFSGTAGFDYTLSDGTLTDIGHVTITVTPVNDAPVALNDNATTAEDTDKTFTQADLKGNDEDVDNTNAELSVTAVSNPINGTVVLNGDGTITFTPTLNFTGTAGFDYTLSDGSLTDTGHVSITVTSIL